MGQFIAIYYLFSYVSCSHTSQIFAIFQKFFSNFRDFIPIAYIFFNFSQILPNCISFLQLFTDNSAICHSLLMATNITKC